MFDEGFSTENDFDEFEVTEANRSVRATQNDKSDDVMMPECIEKWNVGVGCNLIRCKLCVRFPEIVKKYLKVIPKIAQTIGTGYRSTVWKHHITTKYHKACLQASKLSPLLEAKNVNERTTLDDMILGARAHLANSIGRQAITIYADAKQLTVAANSWPARQITNQIANCFDFNDIAKNEESVRKLPMNYLHPSFHLKMMDCIVTVEKNFIQQKLNDCIALSIRVDGSVDRTCLDKIYVIAKIINKSGEMESIFLGIGVQIDRKASGLLATMKQTINNHGTNLYEMCLKKMTSFVTDGASINVGERNGLWKLIDDDAKAVGATQIIVKIWCACHRSDLILKDLKKKIPAVQAIYNEVKNIASNFHKSAKRTVELGKTAEKHKINLMRLPQFHEVRWGEFTYRLFLSILVSWNALAIYFGESKDAGDKYHHGYLLNFEKLRMMTFMTDVLYLFTVFQKKIQSDDLNVISLNTNLKWLRRKMESVRSGSLAGGWEQKLSTLMQTKKVARNENGEVSFATVKTLKQIELIDAATRRNGRNEDFSVLRSKIVDCITRFIDERFAVDDKFIEAIGPFAKLDSNADVKLVMELIAPDVDECELHLQYDDLCNAPELKNLSLLELLSRLGAPENSSFPEVFDVLARVAVATPHSADVERSISASNRMKTSGRSCFDIKTENLWLFIHFNLPALSDWNPRRAVVEWMNRKDRRIDHRIVEQRNQKNHFTTFFQRYFRCSDCEEKIGCR